MSCKLFTNKFNVYNTPLMASELLEGEFIIASDAVDGILFTHLENGKETIYSGDDSNIPPDVSPIILPPYKHLDK